MKIKRLEDLEPIESAKKEFRAWWDEMWKKEKEKMPCPCDGSKEDLEALGYCDYELSLPDWQDGYRITSIIWGGIIQSHTDLCWGYDGSEYMLFRNSDCFPRYWLYPRVRLIEVMNSSVNQFEGFEVLTQRIYFEMLSAQYEPDDIPKFTELFLSMEKEFDMGPNFSNTIIDFQEKIKGWNESHEQIT